MGVQCTCLIHRVTYGVPHNSVKPPLYTRLRHSCHLWATRKKISGRSVVAQTQKILFLCNCCSMNLGPYLNHQDCWSGTTSRTKEAEWRQNHCHGGPRVVVVAEWRHSGRHAQWTPLVGQRGHNGGKREAETSFKLIHNVYNGTHFYWAINSPTLCVHSATTAMYVPSSCLLWATCERPTSATFVRLFWTCPKLQGDHGVHDEVWTSCVPPLNDQGKLSASFVPSTAIWPVLWSHKGGTKVAAPV